VIDGLPEDEREAFELLGIQGMTQADVAHVLGVSAEKVMRACCCRSCRRFAAAGSRCAPSRRTSMRRLPSGS
jgi:hypothetical protein